MCDICGIIPCGQPIQFVRVVTCDEASHVEWHKQWMNHFKWLSYPGVRCVIRCQNATMDENNPNTNQQANDNPDANAPTLNVRLHPLQDTPGHKVVHTFRAGTIYCVQTVQWACGMPIGWGKCYKSESSPQVLSILDNIWGNHLESKPGFIAYDDACDLLSHCHSGSNQRLAREHQVYC
jgi:hypothetical protein